MSGQPDFKSERHRKRHKAVKDEWAEIRRQLLPAPCMCGCGFPATELHHLVSRAQGGDDVPENLAPMAMTCHFVLETGDQASAFRVGFNLSVDQRRYVAEKKGEWWLRKFYGVSVAEGVTSDGRLTPTGSRQNLGTPSATEIPPGEKCPTCARKIPHPRKPDSPTSKAKSYRVPTDEVQGHEDVVDAALDYIGAKGKPFEVYRLVTLGAALVLQDPDAKDYYGRAA